MDTTVRVNVHMKSSTSMTIGQVAERFGLATHVLRHWESVGLLSPARVSGQRRYSEADAIQVSFIVLGKEFGFGLQELRELLDIHDRAARDAALLRYRQVLHQRIEQARRQLALIDHGLTCPVPDYRDCPHIRELAASR
jgi:DNA-binding transcriptional MerR regulator